MSISDWSSDVCSSDLVQFTTAANLKDRIIVGFIHSQGHIGLQFAIKTVAQLAAGHELAFTPCQRRGVDHEVHGQGGLVDAQQDRKRVVEGKSGSVRVVLGGRRIIKKNKKNIKI